MGYNGFGGEGRKSDVQFKVSYKIPERTLSALEVCNTGMQRCEGGYSWGPGVRDHYLAHYVASGRGVYQTGGRLYALSAGDVFLARPDENIFYQADAQEPWVYYWVGFHGSDARLLLDQTDLRRQPVLRGAGEKTAERMRRIYEARGGLPWQTAEMAGLLYQLLAAFPFPIILALLLNYCISNRLRKVTQMVTYAPHFISTVVLVGMMMVFMSQNGIFNQVLGKVGAQPVPFLTDAGLFRHIYVWSHVWQRTGYNSVIYIAALAGVSPELHEAAIVDGANKLQRIWHIDVPAILPTAIILLIMNTGNVLSIGFEKVYLMQNDLNLSVSEIISTYVYKVGLLNGKFSYTTAIGLFNSLINVILLLIVNWISGKVSETSLF